MNNDVRFEQLWNDYIEGELDVSEIAELQQLLAADKRFIEMAADSFQVHRLLGLNAEDSETRHENFVRATMAKLPLSETEFVGEVMQELSVTRTDNPFRKTFLSCLAVVALVLLAVFLFFRNSAASELARITGVHGAVQWTGQGGVIQELNDVGHVLRGGTLETQSADAWADLKFRDGTTVTVHGRSLLTLSELEQKVLHLRYGNISADVAPQSAACPMLVHTPSAELTVLGTQFDVEAVSESTRLTVNQGKVRLKRLTDGEEVSVPAQQSVLASMEDQGGLSLSERNAPVTVWRSDLNEDIVMGKWASRLWMVGAKLKNDVASGRMTKEAAMVAYKKAARFDDEGSVWAKPSAFGSLIVLSPRRSMEQPLLLNANTRIRVRGQAFSQVDLRIGLTVHHADGGFAGKYSTILSAEDSRLIATPLERNDQRNAGRAFGRQFEMELPISAFRDETDPDSSPHDKELVDWWCLVENSSAKLEVTSVELTDIPVEDKP